MKKLLLVVLCVLLNIDRSLAEIRTWTSMNGSTIEAELQRVSAGNAVLKKADGEIIRFPIQRLIKEDREYIKSPPQQNPTAAPAKTLGKRFKKLLAGEKLFNAKGEEVPYSEIAGKYLGVYFCGASWCHASIDFTPELVKARKRMIAQGNNFEVLYISCDKSEDDMYKAMKDFKMKWPAITYQKKAYAYFWHDGPKIKGTPTLHIYNPEGIIISATGWPEVEEKGKEAFEYWMEIERKHIPKPE